ncbi:MAG: hypothetical protein JNL17_02865 [Cyclobacteriaceae bacterium]|nr:hypothetical protein [Cyclobacteriaceae bacterium]
MKAKLVSVLAMLMVILGTSCQAPKSQYQTSLGKKKLKYYNALQFGKEKNPKKTF